MDHNRYAIGKATIPVLFIKNLVNGPVEMNITNMELTCLC